jgi:hypothetical protein
MILTGLLMLCSAIDFEVAGSSVAEAILKILIGCHSRSLHKVVNVDSNTLSTAALHVLCVKKTSFAELSLHVLLKA